MSENKLLAICVVAIVLGGAGAMVGGVWAFAIVGLVIAAIALAPERSDE